jgi:hypothetical protein
MAYSAVCMYANEDSSTYHEYHLTYEAIRDGDEEIETEDGNRYTKNPQTNGNKLLLKMARMVEAIRSIRLNVLLMRSFLLRLQMKKSKR